MRFAELAAASADLAATTSRRSKAERLAAVLRSAAPDEIPVVVAMLLGEPRQGRLGVGWRTLQAIDVAPAAAPTLSVLDVDRALDDLAAIGGSGSTAQRHQRLGALFAAATDAERHLLWGVFGGELRHGALGGVMLDAISRAAEVPADAVRRAHLLLGDLGATARLALVDGAAGLASVAMTPGRAVEPMLASPAGDVAEALQLTGAASVEWKLDGARIQAHRRDGDVRLYTRNLNEITDRLPGVVDLVAGLPGGDIVLDGEVAGAEPTPRSFQDTMGDFGAAAASGRGGGLVAYFFDVLHVDGTSLIDEPLRRRREVLVERLPERHVLPGIVTADAGSAEQFFTNAVAAGYEGVVVKDLESTYAAGRRGGSWRKVKPVHTFDLVVLAAEWGHGRRRGWLSNLHLGARGDDGWVMVGKTFKGLTDQLLTWQTEALLARQVSDDGHVVVVRPELVVEIAIDGVQRSTRYPGGVALRFARVRRYRDDKTPDAADRIETLQALLGR